jgi:hypothetical protein
MSEAEDDILCTPRPGWEVDSFEVKRRRALFAARVLPMSRYGRTVRAA